MNSSGRILVVDVNIIIHLEKVGLLDELTSDKNVRIVDLVLYQEYLFKKNSTSEKASKIKTIKLNEDQVAEAQNCYLNNRRNSVFDYFSYIAARDNNCILLTGDWKLKKYINNEIEVYGAIWYVQQLKLRGIIDNKRLMEIYNLWLNDASVYIPSDKLLDLIIELEEDDR